MMTSDGTFTAPDRHDGHKSRHRGMTTRTPTAFGAELRRYRLAAGLSQEALAERARLSAAAVAALEAGRRSTPRPETLARLADALGLAPPARRALISALPEEHPTGAEAGAPEPTVSPVPPSTGSVIACPLPAAMTTLIGREREQAAVADLLVKEGGSRLVTLTGPGGVGKTCLALTVAAALAPAYPDGTAFIDLSALRDPQLVAPMIGHTLGLREDGDRDMSDLLRASLHERRLLLVLDNFEQVVEGAPLLADLVAACPRLTILVTSRIALRVRAEQRFAVTPLAVPLAEQGQTTSGVERRQPTVPPGASERGQSTAPAVETYAAVQLFVTRARAVQPNFSLTSANVAAVAELCRRLDGLPLAIELAAARVVLLPPAELLRRLEQRLAVLSRGARDLPPRQQSLHATIGWSYELLSPHEQALFRRLSVFVGGGTLEAIASIGAAGAGLDVLDMVASLVDRSLLRVDGQQDPRVGMLDTLHAYAGEQLELSGEAAQVRRAHAAYYQALADEAEPHLRGGEQAAWLMRLAAEHDNLRAALAWALRQGAVALGWRLGGALWRFWYLHGHIGEGRRWLSRLLDLAVDRQLTDEEEYAALMLARAKVLGGAGVFAELQGDYPAAARLHEESLALREQYGDRWGVADSLDDLGVLADSQGDAAGAHALFDRALALFEELGDAWGMALVLSNKGYLAREHGAAREAAALHEKSLALFRAVGDRRNVAFTLNNLGEAWCDQGEYARARALCDESRTLRQALGDMWGVAISSASLGRVAQAEGAYADAQDQYAQSLSLFRNLGATWNTACTLDSMSSLAREQGAYAQAATYHAESLALFQAIGDAKGAARALTTAAHLACARGDHAQAERLCQESLRMYREIGTFGGVVPCLECLSQVLCWPGGGPAVATMGRMKRVERGVRLWAAATALRETRGTPRTTYEQAAYERSLGTAREVLDAPTFTTAWVHGVALSLEQVLEQALGKQAIDNGYALAGAGNAASR